MTDPERLNGQLRIYSLGTVAENKKRSESTIQVIPVESLPLLDGEVRSDPQLMESEGTDSEGNHYVATSTLDNALEADWLPLSEGHRMNAPDVRRGERVLLWRFADAPELYWTPMGLDNHLRKLETATFMFSATTDEAEEELNADNSYTLTVSSHEGHITLTTTTANEELTKWAMQINTKEGRFLLTEENGNEIEIDAANALIGLTNADQSKVLLDRTNIYVECTDGLYVKTGKTVQVNTQTVLIECKDITINCTDYKLNATSVAVDASTIDVTSNTNTFNSPQSTFSGAVKCATIDCGSAKIGGISIEGGQIQCSGITSSGPVRAPNIN